MEQLTSTRVHFLYLGLEPVAANPQVQVDSTGRLTHTMFISHHAPGSDAILDSELGFSGLDRQRYNTGGQVTLVIV